MKTKTSISHLTSKEQNTLHCLKKKIVEQLPTLLIFCFNSSVSQSINRSCFTAHIKEETWNFSCDLLIVVPDGTEITDDIQKETDALLSPFGKVTAFIHPLNFVIKQIQDHNLFFTWVRRSATVLFNKDNSLQILPPSINKREEYRQQVAQFYSDNPRFENYLDKKIALLSQPVVDENQNTNTQKEISDKSVKKISIDTVGFPFLVQFKSRIFSCYTQSYWA